MFYIKSAGYVAVALILWGAFVLFTTLQGWWREPIAPTTDEQAFAVAAIGIVDRQNVGNVAFVLIENGEISAEHYAGVSQPIDADTMFPLASASKWITALGVMTLVHDARLDLDAPISNYLTRWQLPDSEFDRDRVTARGLLSHTAGLNDGLGFGDYLADETLPSLEASLTQPRASSGTPVQIALGREPGTEWDYSGGGYLILQLVIEEVSGQAFATYINSALLQPLAMTRSSFDFIGSHTNVSTSYDADGLPAPHYQYAAAAATGLSTSAADMTKLVLALANESNLLPTESMATMREPNADLYGFDLWGLGTILYTTTDSGDFIYGHDGQNEPAINSAIRINPDNGDAIIVFSSGNKSLATLIGFEWVLWQTGKPDLLGIGYVIDGGIQILTYGALTIFAFAIIAIGLIRRSNPAS